MQLEPRNCIILPYISTYHVLAINLDTEECESLFLSVKIPLSPLDEITLDTAVKSTIETFSKHLKELTDNWVLYLIPELTRPYNFTQTLRLNRYQNYDLAPMEPSLIHTFIEQRKPTLAFNLSQEEVINIIKFFNLARSHADFATKLISARKDELTSQLNISQRALSDTLVYLEMLELIAIKKSRRPKGRSLPDMIMLSDTFFELAFDIDVIQLAQLTDKSLKKINSTKKTTENLYHNSGLFFTCKSIIKRAEELLPKLTVNQSQSLSSIAEDIIDTEFTETSTSKLQEARIDGINEDLHKLQEDIKEVSGYFYRNLESICNSTSVYTTTDEARKGYEELEIFILEKKAIAKKLYLSGDIKDRRALTSLSYLL